MATSKQLQVFANDAIAFEVYEGLTANPKHLPSKLFYDEAGSQLFEQITELPEYYLTRTERSIFENFAADIIHQAGSSLTLVELGAGTATKTSILLEELLRQQSRALFYPIDVSPTALDQAMRRLGEEFPSLRVNPVANSCCTSAPASAILNLRTQLASCAASGRVCVRATLCCSAPIMRKAPRSSFPPTMTLRA